MSRDRLSYLSWLGQTYPSGRWRHRGNPEWTTWRHSFLAASRRLSGRWWWWGCRGRQMRWRIASDSTRLKTGQSPRCAKICIRTQHDLNIICIHNEFRDGRLFAFDYCMQYWRLLYAVLEIAVCSIGDCCMQYWRLLYAVLGIVVCSIGDCCIK